MNSWVNLSWEDLHDSVGGHIESDSCTWLQLGFVDFGSASNDISGATSKLDHDFLICQLLEDLADELSNTL